MGLAPVDLGEGPMHVQQAGSADQPLDRDALIAATQDAQDLVLDGVSRCETGMAALGRHGDFPSMMVPGEGRDAEAGARAEDGDGGMGIAGSRAAERGELVRRNDRRTPGQGLEIIDQTDRIQAEGLQLSLGHPPGRIGQVDLAVGDRPRHGEDAARRLDVTAVEKGLHATEEGRMLRRRKALMVLKHRPTLDHMGQGKAGVGSADVTNEKGPIPGYGH